MLVVLGSASPGLYVAVLLGSVGGDLVESMVKRRAGVEDAGAWLPDSGLLVLPPVPVLA